MDIQQIYWLFEYGFPRKKMSPDEMLGRLELLDRPVFFLSTGRCGTKWFANLFKHSQEIKAFHAPKPDLSSQNIFAYHIQQNSDYSANEIYDILAHIFLAGRQEYLRYSYKTSRRYIETNNHITFFAPAIARMLPQSKFVHIVRHPGDFVSSGLKRHWYDDEGSNFRQITPCKGIDIDLWKNFSKIEKISWLWTVTNNFIEEFKSQIHSSRIITINFPTKKSEDIEILYDHLGIKIPNKNISKFFDKKMNFQTYKQSEKFEQWLEKDRADLKRICEPLALKYNFNL